MISRTNPPRRAPALYLFDGVRQYFADKGSKTLVVFGRRERAKQITEGIGVQNRIVILPGNVKDGNDGAFSGAVGPGGNPRKIITQEKIVTLSLFAGAPNADARNEEAIYAALIDMQEQITSAVQAVLMASATWKSGGTNPDPLETRFGGEYLIELGISATFRALEEGIPTAGVTPAIDRGGVTVPPDPT